MFETFLGRENNLNGFQTLNQTLFTPAKVYINNYINLYNNVVSLQGDSGGPLLINSEADDKLEIVGEFT